MADPRDEKPFDVVTLEPVPGDASRFRLTIEPSVEDLTRLIDPFIGQVKIHRRREADRRRSKRQLEKEANARRAAARDRGKTISDAVDRFRAGGMSQYEATKAAARDLGIATSAAQDLMRFCRATLREERNARILDLHRRGLAVREIGKRMGISASTAAEVISKAPTPDPDAKPKKATRAKAKSTRGAGEGSSAFSGDRAPKARRKALDASEAPQRSPQGSGREGSGNAAPSLPEPLPVGETRGRGGKASTNHCSASSEGSD